MNRDEKNRREIPQEAGAMERSSSCVDGMGTGARKKMTQIQAERRGRQSHVNSDCRRHSNELIIILDRRG
jgi:hypothetical protein